MSIGVEPITKPVTYSREMLYKAPKSQFVPIVINGKLVFRFDPQRGLIEYQSRGEKHIIDLAEYTPSHAEESAIASAVLDGEQRSSISHSNKL